MHPAENSVSHLLWCIIVALRTAEEDSPFTSETARRRFISNWLNSARDKPSFRDMPGEFTTLRELLNKTSKSVCVTEILVTLLENAHEAQRCDLFRFRSAVSMLLGQGWKHTVCRYPESISEALLARQRGSGLHALQLTRTEQAFLPVGEMIMPVTFQILVSNTDSEPYGPEIAFHNEGFDVVLVGGELKLNERIIRTMHIGLPSIPTAEWNPLHDHIWAPPLENRAYH
ncbi:hypothetical protein CIG19_20140 [Enterobacterales bacterium CwR94]|nr:hypothetical protein CIG19_20140 [Enterobacterales bacterium CwR94]